MADIKLVIRIPKTIKEELDKYGEIDWFDTARLKSAVRNGTPLDDVKAEMQKRADDSWNMAVGSASKGLENAIEILDNIGETE